jgi:hypothetical protein
MYLYAGHYLFAIFLLTGRFVVRVKGAGVKKMLIVALAIAFLATLGWNVFQHANVLATIRDAYEQGF